ncbi:MAG: hypothetical protein CMM50_00955 [Rhodospirillaceae bacterium]|nr:hypothetical protein [Rhodospirillaceae bacterium]
MRDQSDGPETGTTLMTERFHAGWVTGLGRLCVLSAAIAVLLSTMPEVIRWASARSLYLTGYGLLIGGYLSLAALYLGASWVVRGFAGPPHIRGPRNGTEEAGKVHALRRSGGRRTCSM